MNGARPVPAQPGPAARHERLGEQRLRALVEAGELTGLPGDGRPFARGDLEGNDSTWAAFRLMRNNKVLPAWSQERIDIDAELDRLRSRCRGHRAWLDARVARLWTLPADRMVEAARVTAREDGRFLAELESAVRDLDRRIDGYNALVPAASLSLLPVSAAGLLASVS